MCGIAGALSLDGSGQATPDVAAACRRLRHRGPDGWGVRELGPVVLGHTRLSIIDLATGDQPMSNEDGTVWVAFNGEIFNFVELRRELEGFGHHFRTRSDTETLVHAYEQWGDEFVTRLNGQFAIALWDVTRRRLLLIRDRVGIRPLFVRAVAGSLCFASEIKALARLSREPLRLDPRGLSEVFTFWSAVESRTVFQGVQSVPAGHMLVCEDGRQQLRRYWDWEFPRAGETRVISLDDADRKSVV